MKNVWFCFADALLCPCTTLLCFCQPVSKFCHFNLCIQNLLNHQYSDFYRHGTCILRRVRLFFWSLLSCMGAGFCTAAAAVHAAAPRADAHMAASAAEQQLHDLPAQQQTMHFGYCVCQTQLYLQQFQMQQQEQQEVSLLPPSLILA